MASILSPSLNHKYDAKFESQVEHEKKKKTKEKKNMFEHLRHLIHHEMGLISKYSVP